MTMTGAIFLDRHDTIANCSIGLKSCRVGGRNAEDQLADKR